MTKSSIEWTCIATDHVEADLDWEAGEYAVAGVRFASHKLRMASPVELINVSKEADVLVVDQAKISSQVIDGLVNCKLIIRHGDGFDNLDLIAATKAGIVCANQPGFWSREAAEQAFTMALSLALKIPSQQTVARNPRLGVDSGWSLSDVMPYRGLSSLTIGILGCGKIGSIAAKLFAQVAGRVLVDDPYSGNASIDTTGGVSATLDEVVAESDIVSIHIPANDKTVGLFNRELINRMKPGAILVNTARGAIVDTEAILEAIDSGHLGGAALDSTNPEPLPGNHPLFSRDNVIITPHLAWYSENALWNLRRSIVRDTLAAREGKKPDSIVNPEVLNHPNLRLRK